MSDVPIGYLITTAILAWGVFWSVAPMRISGHFGRLSFYSSLIINEVPFLALAWLGVSTLLALSEGALQGTPGRVVAALAALTAAGLIFIGWRGVKAIPAVRTALNDGLGPGWQAQPDEDVPLRAQPRFHPIALAGPFFRRQGPVERIADLPYGDAGERNLLDIYRHRSRPTNAPMLIHVHGGAMVRGRRNREALPMLYRLASHGWVCASANYRLQPAHPFPAQLIDVKRAIAWMRDHATDYGGIPETIFVAGGSTGAQLTTLAALTANDARFQPGFASMDTSVAGVVALYGYFGWIDGELMPHALRTETEAAPVDRLAVPPFFLAHGDHDTVTAVEDTRRLVRRLRAISSNAVVYVELPGAQHNFDLLHSIRGEAVIDGVESFADWVRFDGNRSLSGMR